MRIKLFDAEKDYSDLCSWWKAQNWPSIERDFLSKTGIIVENDKDKLCAGFLYTTDSSFAIMEFIIGNPEVPKDERGKALDMLINELSKEAKKQGFKALFTMTNHSKLIDRYTKNDFQETDKNVSHFVRRL